MEAGEEIDVSGRVLEVSRKEGFKETIELLIEVEGEGMKVDFPISSLESDLDLIPYQLAFEGQEIIYGAVAEDLHGRGLTDYSTHEENYSLRVVSGPLEGKEYFKNISSGI